MEERMYKTGWILFAGIVIGTVMGGQLVAMRADGVARENVALKASLKHFDDTTPMFVNHVIELLHRIKRLESEKVRLQKASMPRIARDASISASGLNSTTRANWTTRLGRVH